MELNPIRKTRDRRGTRIMRASTEPENITCSRQDVPASILHVIQDPVFLFILLLALAVAIPARPDWRCPFVDRRHRRPPRRRPCHIVPHMSRASVIPSISGIWSFPYISVVTIY